MSKIRLFYSGKQRETSGICKFLNPKTGRYENYTEMCSNNSFSNWNDAICIYEGEEPKIKNRIDLKIEKAIFNATNGEVKSIGKNGI